MDAIATAERQKPAVGFDPLSPEYLPIRTPPLPPPPPAPAFYCKLIDHWVVTRYHDIRQYLPYADAVLRCQR